MKTKTYLIGIILLIITAAACRKIEKSVPDVSSDTVQTEITPAESTEAVTTSTMEAADPSSPATTTTQTTRTTTKTHRKPTKKHR